MKPQIFNKQYWNLNNFEKGDVPKKVISFQCKFLFALLKNPSKWKDFSTSKDRSKFKEFRYPSKNGGQKQVFSLTFFILKIQRDPKIPRGVPHFKGGTVIPRTRGKNVLMGALTGFHGYNQSAITQIIRMRQLL